MVGLVVCCMYNGFFFNDTATTEIYTLSLHDALPIWSGQVGRNLMDTVGSGITGQIPALENRIRPVMPDRSEEHTSVLQSLTNLVCRLPLEKKNKKQRKKIFILHL